jgi:hypothetical protein
VIDASVEDGAEDTIAVTDEPRGHNGAGADPDASGRAAVKAGGNTGDHVGTSEAGAFASHGHGVNDPGHSHALGIQTWGLNGLGSVAYAFGTNGSVNTNPPTNPSGTGISIQAAGGSETRPANVTVNYIIKL